MTDDLLNAALDYAKAGIKVFPLKPRDKAPLTLHGFKDATTDEAQIRGWWTEWPDANIGAPAGANGWSVLDIDTDSPSEGYELARQLGIDEVLSPISRTGKGRQLFFQAVQGLGPSVRVADGPVDVRSGECYVVLPPSVHPNGRTYRWNVPLLGAGSVPLSEMPAKTRKLLTRTDGKPVLAGKTGGNVPRGRQHDALVRIAGWHRREGSDAAQIAAVLRATSDTWDPRPSNGDCRDIAESVGRYESHGHTEPACAFAEADLLEMDLSKAISVLKSVLDHPDPFFHISLILGAAQDHIIDLLHTVFYIIFSGGPDTGKSTANAATMALTRDGVVLGGATGPYLRDTLGNGRAVAISEFEALLKENAQLLAVIRNGNRRITAKVGLKIAAGKGWKNADVDTFGFKTMDYHDRLDAHVLGRSLRFEMVVSKSLDVAMDAEYLRERLAPIRAWLAHRAAEAKAVAWTAERVRETWDSKEFRDRVKAFRNAWGRHGIIAAYLLLVNDIFEFGLEDHVRDLMDSREPDLSETAEEVQEAIEELVGQALPSADFELRTNDILAKVNALRNERGLRPRTSISGGLRELGFSRKIGDWVPAKKNRHEPNRGKAVVLPYEKVRFWRPSEGSAANPIDATPTIPTSPKPEPGLAILSVHDIIAELTLDNGGASLEEVLQTAGDRGIPRERAAGILNRMRTEGDTFEPSAGRVRLVNSLSMRGPFE